MIRPILYIKTYWKESMAGFAPLERPKGDPTKVLSIRSAEEAWEIYSSGWRAFIDERRGGKFRSRAVLKAEEEKRKREEEWDDDWKEVKDAWRLDPRLTPETIGTNVGHMTSNSVQQLRIIALEGTAVFKECLFEFLRGYQEGKAGEIEKGPLGPEVFDHINSLKDQAIGKKNKRKNKNKKGTAAAMLQQDDYQSIKPPMPIASRPTMFSYAFTPPVEFTVMSICARRPTQAAWDVHAPGARLTAAATTGWFETGNDDDDDDGALGALRDKLLAWADANVEEYHNRDPNASTAEDDKTGLQQIHRMVEQLTDKKKKKDGEGEEEKEKKGDGSSWFGSMREKVVMWADGNMEKIDAEKFAEQNNNKDSLLNKSKSEQLQVVRESLLAWADEQKKRSTNKNHSSGGRRASSKDSSLTEDIRIKMIAWANDEDEAITKRNGGTLKKEKKSKKKKEGQEKDDAVDAAADDDDHYDDPRNRMKNMRNSVRGWMAGLSEEARSRSSESGDDSSSSNSSESADESSSVVRGKPTENKSTNNVHHYSSVDTRRGYTLANIQNKIAAWDAAEEIMRLNNNNIKQQGSASVTIPQQQQQQQ